MFDNLKGMGQMAALMKDLPRIKAQMEEVKARLGELEVEAETGGGAVRARANGHLKVLAIDVEPALLAGLVDVNDPADRGLATDLITGAVNAALVKAREAAAAEVQRAASDLDLPIPPGALDGLLG